MALLIRTEPRLIRSRDNALVKRLLRVATSSRERRRSGTTILDGEHLVRAYQQSGGTAVLVAAGESAYVDLRVRRIFDETPARARVLLTDELLGKISGVVTSSGLLAMIETPQPEPLPDSVTNCVILDSIQDPGNLGSVLRSACAAGIKHVFLSPGTVFAWAPKVVRAGQGAHFYLSIHENVPLAKVTGRAGGKVVAAVPRGGVALFDTDLRGPIAWVFGNEGSGLSDQATALATHQVHIPMPGGAESLNVAAAAAVCLFEQLRQNIGKLHAPARNSAD